MTKTYKKIVTAYMPCGDFQSNLSINTVIQFFYARIDSIREGLTIMKKGLNIIFEISVDTKNSYIRLREL